jgi:hypothetical protein
LRRAQHENKNQQRRPDDHSRTTQHDWY